MTVVPMPKRGKAATSVAKPYVPTLREATALETYKKRRKGIFPLPTMKVEMSDGAGKRVASLAVDHPDPAIGYDLLSEALSADSNAFLAGTLDALGLIAQRGDTVVEGQMNYALAIVSGVRPKDQIEATLDIQMAAIHLAAMNAAANMGAAKTWELRESQERTLNRLARTFVAQVEALKRYRSKGVQRVIIERVTVEKVVRQSSATSLTGMGWSKKNDR